MQLEYDETKSARNKRERGTGFDRFVDMDTESAVTVEDSRRDYGEVRLRVSGIILRRANRREERAYEKERESS